MKIALVLAALCACACATANNATATMCTTPEGGHGVCHTTSTPCSGGHYDSRNLCPGVRVAPPSAPVDNCLVTISPLLQPDNVQCCVWPSCTTPEGQGGQCQLDSLPCSGKYDSRNLCPGADNIQCCVTGAAPSSTRQALLATVKRYACSRVLTLTHSLVQFI